MGSLSNSTGTFGHMKEVEPSDDELWARSRAGDPDAFGALFERHAKLIFNYCFRRIGNRDTARDLLQVAFLEAWRRRDKELPPDKVLPWLYGVATNVLRNQRRSERRFEAAMSRLPLAEVEPDFADRAAEHLDYERQAEKAIDLLQALPQKQREVFVLCVGMELSYEDAAYALDIPVGTVRSRLSSARRASMNSIPAPDMSRVNARTPRRHPSHDRPDLIPTSPRSLPRRA